MFVKLLKYEWRANAKLLSVLSIAALGIGLLATVLLRLMFNLPTDLPEGLQIVGSIVLFFSLWSLAFALFAIPTAACLILYIRFYKNKFTDEGYLTFTLPVNCRQIYLSSYVSILGWTAIVTVATLLAAFLAISIGTATEGLFNTDIWEVYSLTAAQLSGSDYSGIFLVYGAFILIALLCTPSMIMSCITAGAVIAKKHKILAAIGLYYGINTVLSTLSSIVTVVGTIAAATSASETIPMLLPLIATMLPTLILGVGGYFLSTYLMKNKLNLP